MIGTKRGCVMNRARAFCNCQNMPCEADICLSKSHYSGVVLDKNLITVPWACAGLKIPQNSLRVFLALAILWEGKLVGTLLFHDGYASKDVWWTIYTTDKHWCQRRFLRQFFKVAFDDLNCRRIGILVQEDNKSSLKLVRRIGFQEEGRLRCIGENGEDCLVFSLLKSDENSFYMRYNAK